jgi:hypothetical protein
MASWQEERDRLIAQTQAFVQRVAAARPVAAMSPTAPVSSARDIVVEPVIVRPAIVEPATAAVEFQADPLPEILEDMPSGALDLDLDLPLDLSCLPITASRTRPIYKPASERADILQHVATFQARQRKMALDRETYYERMQAQIRKSLGNDSDPDRL